MKIVTIAGHPYYLHGRPFSRPLLMTVLLSFLLLCIGGMLWTGYQLGQQSVEVESVGTLPTEAVQELLLTQRREIREAQESTRRHLDALALRLGEMQARILRLDALGERLADQGKLDTSEFNFDQEPARGGLESGEYAQSVTVSELVSGMDLLARTIENREHKLELLESLLEQEELHDEAKPSGRPVSQSWISSRYGYRNDPFTGKKAFHHGVDVAGKEKSEVVAVAAGIVTEAGKKSGYGYLVEIHHAGGYVTRYGHNSKIFVKEGDLVSKGDVIGLLGSSGRSTGPHVHFEVALNGKSVNPAKYLR